MAKAKQTGADSLQAVLRAEKDIQSLITSEKERAESWLSSRKDEILRNRNRLLLAMRKELLLDRRAAEAEMRAETEGLRENSRQSAATLAAVTEEEIIAIVRRHLAQLIPKELP
jgi:hypothetical protein